MVLHGELMELQSTVCVHRLLAHKPRNSCSDEAKPCVKTGIRGEYDVENGIFSAGTFLQHLKC